MCLGILAFSVRSRFRDRFFDVFGGCELNRRFALFNRVGAEQFKIRAIRAIRGASSFMRHAGQTGQIIGPEG